VKFAPTSLAGAFAVELERLEDERGFFARSFCQDEFRKHGLKPLIAQCNVSWNRTRGTLRGLHYQAPPHAEVKLVRCIRGALFDVAVDLRPDSPGFRRWVGVELTPDNGRALYIPRGFGHGFYTLADATEVEYQISAEYHPETARGARFDDPMLGVVWPAAPEMIAERDHAYPDLTLDRLQELRGL
jgi:dTDP-4-dehydrorhamnose 3,5-epimerase